MLSGKFDKGSFWIFSVDQLTEHYGAKPARTSSYWLLWIRSGAGSIGVDYFAHALTGQTLWLINEHRTLHVDLNGAEGWAVCFTEHFLPLSSPEKEGGLENILYYYFCHSPFVALTPDHRDRIERTFADLREEYAREDRQAELLRAYLKILLLQYQRLIKEGAVRASGNGRYERVVALRRDIEQHYKKHKEAAFYADKQAITAKRLNEIVKQALGKTVTDQVHERLMLEAKRMLHFTGCSVKEIAFELGFNDPAYFYRFFKRSEQLTPEVFRSRLQRAA